MELDEESFDRFQEIHRPLISRELSKCKNSGRILEAGCGDGYWVNFFNNMGFQAYGIDISKVAIDRAVTANSNTKQSYIIGDVRRLPLAPNTFDYIFSFGVLEHFPEPITTLIDFYRVIRPNGQCLVTVPNIFSIQTITIPIQKILGKFNLGRQSLFSRNSIKNLLKQAGFKNVETGIVPSEFLFGITPLFIPFIGERIFRIASKMSLFIENRQSTFGFFLYAKGEKVE